MKTQYKNHWDMLIDVKKHFSAYNDYNFKEFKRHNMQPYMLSNEYTLDQTLLVKNRAMSKELINILQKKNLYNTNNLNILSLLDFIMPFYEKCEKLNQALRIKSPIKHFEIKQKMERYFDYDLLLNTETDEMIAVKWMYIDNVNFDNAITVQENQIFYGKFPNNTKNEDYSRINGLFEKPINPYIFKKFRELWLYVYHQFVVSEPTNKYVLLCYPKFNAIISKHISEFMSILKHENIFKYADRIYTRHLEDIVHLEHDYEGKYLYFKPSRFNIIMEMDTYWHSKESEEYKEFENIKPLNSVQEMQIQFHKAEIDEKMIKQAINDGTERFIVRGKHFLKLAAKLLEVIETEPFSDYDVDYLDRFIHKEYQNDIDIVILHYDLE